jgi:ABC-2 type transport system ATP-binding protein
VTAETAEPPRELDRLPGIHDPRVDDGRVTFEVDGEHLHAAIGRLHELGIRSLTSHPPTLEQLFMRHYEHDLAPAASGGQP